MLEWDLAVTTQESNELFLREFKCPDPTTAGKWNLCFWKVAGNPDTKLVKKEHVQACDFMWFDPSEHPLSKPRTVLEKAKQRGVRHLPVAASCWRESSGEMVMIIDSVVPVSVRPKELKLTTAGEAIVRAMVVKTRATSDGTGDVDGTLKFWHLGPGSGGGFYIGLYRVASWVGFENGNMHPFIHSREPKLCHFAFPNCEGGRGRSKCYVAGSLLSPYSWQAMVSLMCTSTRTRTELGPHSWTRPGACSCKTCVECVHCRPGDG